MPQQLIIGLHGRQVTLDQRSNTFLLQVGSQSPHDLRQGVAEQNPSSANLARPGIVDEFVQLGGNAIRRDLGPQVMRDVTERPEGIAAGNARLVGTDRERIREALLELLTDDVVYQRMAKAGNPYGDGKSSQRIVEIVAAFLNQPMEGHNT